jgi:2-polyprenyl-3-methyl-5-hydroxy-6-metoxy-1,4-benzoquinol methylase
MERSQEKATPPAATDHSPHYTYENWRTNPDPPHQPLYLEIVLRYLRADPSIRRVLDAGCGNGSFTASIAEAGFDLYGVDLSSSGIEVARETHPGVHFERASVYDDFTNLFPGVSTFDAIVSVEVIEHLYSPRDFVRRAHEALRPGGLFVVTTPYWGYLKNIALALTNRIDQALGPLWDGGHIKHWSRKTLASLLLEQPFEMVGFTGAGRPVPGLWNGMVMAVRKRK